MGDTTKKRNGKRVPMDENIRQALVEKLTERFGLICWYCGVRLKPRKFHLDHVEPLSMGGADSLENLALACATCNRAKWNLTLAEFYEWAKRIRWLDDFPAKRAFALPFYDRGDEPGEETDN